MLSLPEGVGLQLNSLGAYPHDLPGGPHTRYSILTFSLLCPYLGYQVRVGPAPSAFVRTTVQKTLAYGSFGSSSFRLRAHLTCN